jgi:hypothetical protein
MLGAYDYMLIIASSVVYKSKEFSLYKTAHFIGHLTVSQNEVVE